MVLPARRAQPKRTEVTEAKEARVHGGEEQLIDGSVRVLDAPLVGVHRRTQRCMFAERLTFELNCPRRRAL